MSLMFGFELEGFYREDGELSIPPKDYPTDGFPGLVELRTSGYKRLDEAYAELWCQSVNYPNVDFSSHQEIFSPRQRAEIRRRHEIKDMADIQNMYGKYPRPLGNRTIASLQINISNLLRNSRTDEKGVYHAPAWSLLDIPKIVRNLDDEFYEEIRQARRQPGEYAVKDVRLEYRSLPNFAFEFDPMKVKKFLDRIERCVK